MTNENEVTVYMVDSESAQDRRKRANSYERTWMRPSYRIYKDLRGVRAYIRTYPDASVFKLTGTPVDITKEVQ